MKYLLLAPIAVVAACSSFTASDPPDSADGGVDGATTVGPDGAALADATVGPDGVLTLARGLPPGSGIAVWDNVVYWTDANLGIIRSVPAGGGTPAAHLTPGGAPKNPVATANGLYWCNSKDTKGALVPSVWVQSWTGGVRSLPLPQNCLGLAPLSSGSIAIVYGDADGTGNGGATVVDAEVSTIRPTARDLAGNPFGIAARAENVYVTRSSANEVESLMGFTYGADPVARGTYATMANDCQHIAANDTGVFWARPADALIEGRTYGGVAVVLNGQQTPRSLVADQEHLYWRTADGAVRRARTDTAGAKDIEDFATGVGGGDIFSDYYRTIALSTDRVFWLTADGVASKAK